MFLGNVLNKFCRQQVKTRSVTNSLKVVIVIVNVMYCNCLCVRNNNKKKVERDIWKINWKLRTKNYEQRLKKKVVSDHAPSDCIPKNLNDCFKRETSLTGDSLPNVDFVFRSESPLTNIYNNYW